MNKKQWSALIGAGVLFNIGAYGYAHNTQNDFPEYHYDGPVKQEQVQFYEDMVNGSRSTLSVGKADGTATEFVLKEDTGHTLTLESVVNKGAGGKKTEIKITFPTLPSDFVRKAQADLNSYLAGITEAKMAEYK